MTPGSQIAHYKLGSKLGEGGMGAVYRATDTKLNREVAVKVLPPAFAQDSARMQRFEREAQVLASVNHPNIAAIYGIEQGAIVMELVDGADLKGPLPVDTVIEYARQIAAGLEAAHEKGIVHRDLKPANIKVTADGVVKLLDFGLAKAAEAKAAAVSATISPTLSLEMTQAGMILGTAAYMAPEQARGKSVDRRADIWAFGVVVYELLTGAMLFGGGETVSDSLAAVITKEPDWSLLPKETPPHLRRLLQRCLRKDPKLRLQAIGEARIALDEPEAPAAVPARPARSSRLPWIIAAITTTASAVALAAWMRPHPDANILYRVTLPSPEGVIEAPGAGPQAVLSPDGRLIAFVATADQKETLWIRPVGSLAARRLDRTEGASFPFWSPDGRFVGFYGVDKLKKISVEGGTPQVICDVESSGRVPSGDGGTWREDGTIVFSSGRPARLQQVSAAGGTPAPLFPIDEGGGEIGQLWPQALPDDRVLYLSMNRDPAQSGICVRQGKSDRRTLVVKSPVRAVFAPPHYLVYVRDETVVAQPIDPKTFQLTGDPVQMADEVSVNASNGRAAFTVQGNVLLYQTGLFGSANLAWYDRQGRRTPAVARQDRFIAVRLSPDGKTAAIALGAISKSDLWALDVATGALTRVTRTGNLSVHLGPWSPDSRRVLLNPNRAGQPKVEATLGTRELRNVELPGCSMAYDSSADGRTVLCYGSKGVVAVPADGAGNPAKLADDMPWYPQISPDGKRVAFTSPEAGRFQVWLASYPLFADRRQVPFADESSYPQWRSDGRELYFATADSIMAVEVRPGNGIETGTPKVLLKVPFIRGLTRRFAATPDGSRFLVIEQVQSNSAHGIHAVINWQAALSK